MAKDKTKDTAPVRLVTKEEFLEFLHNHDYKTASIENGIVFVTSDKDTYQSDKDRVKQLAEEAGYQQSYGIHLRTKQEK